MTKQEIIDYMYKNHVQGDFKIEEMAEDFAQPDLQLTCNNLATDTISREMALDAPVKMVSEGLEWIPVYHIKELPSAEPERLSDDDFETIRIHLNAQKEKLCNQRRWEEAEEYQRIIDRFMAFVSAEPEIIRCRDCKYSQMTDDDECRYCKIWFAEEEHFLPGNYFCADAERKEECMP